MTNGRSVGPRFSVCVCVCDENVLELDSEDGYRTQQIY